MTVINSTLIITIIFLALFNHYFFKFFIKDKKIIRFDVEKIESLLSELSKSVNNQRIIFLVEKETIFVLTKYQRENFWGIELWINDENKLGRQVRTIITNSNPLIYLENNIVDFENDLKKTHYAIKHIIIDTEEMFKVRIENNARFLYA